MDELIKLYYLKHHFFKNPKGDREEWRVHRISYVESMYIEYNKASPVVLDTCWMWNEWYQAEKSDRQKWFQKMRFDCIAEEHAHPCPVFTCPDYMCDTYVGTITPDWPKSKSTDIFLAPLLTAPCTAYTQQYYDTPRVEKYLDTPKKGINPMKTLTSTTDLTINTSAQPTDASKARDFLLSEFNNSTRFSWQDERYSAFRKMFNIDAPTIPLTSQGIIDAFKNGKVVIDQAKVDKQTKWFAAREPDGDDFDEDYEGNITSRYYGVTFTDLPVADRKGYDAAIAAYDKLKTDTKRKLAILEPEAGLQVLMDFEAWMPTAATTAH